MASGNYTAPGLCRDKSLDINRSGGFPGGPGAQQVHRHITVSVKTASISQDSVVVSHRQRVIELGPADALDLYCKGFADLHPPWRNFHQTLFEIIRYFREHPVLCRNPY